MSDMCFFTETMSFKTNSRYIICLNLCILALFVCLFALVQTPIVDID